VNALRRVHAVLVPGGLVLDTQPVSAHPPVTAAGRELGTLDMRAWGTTIEAIDRLVAETIGDGLFVLDAEHRFVVTDTFDDGREFVEAVRGWQGTRISRALARRGGAGRRRATTDQRRSGGAAACAARAATGSVSGWGRRSPRPGAGGMSRRTQRPDAAVSPATRPMAPP
jgi:hypothetical protein